MEQINVEGRKRTCEASSEGLCTRKEGPFSLSAEMTGGLD